MSFSSEQKLEILQTPIKNSCCKRAFLQGALAARGEINLNEIILSVENREYAEFIAAMVCEIYAKIAEIKVPSRGGRCKLLTFSSPSAIKYITLFQKNEATITGKCQSCQSAFLRGAFFAGGRISDPTKQYSLEFSMKDSTDAFVKLFSEIGLIPRISVKPNERVIYFKNSSSIEDFFAMAGMNNTVFSLMNAKIQGEIRNNVNRIANCETNNIGKAVSASLSQIELIEALADKGLISQLPEELEKTAILRMEHRDLSLSQLSLIITPRISKPGLSHRLKRITELAKALLKEK